MDLLERLKANLVIGFDDDDMLLNEMLKSAISEAEFHQGHERGYYEQQRRQCRRDGYSCEDCEADSANDPMSESTKQGVILLASSWYENRVPGGGGFTAGKYISGNATQAAERAAKSLFDRDRVCVSF